jgi:glutaredoxin
MRISGNRRPSRSFAAAIVLAGFAAGAGAQQVYRIVGPDGRITFSDKPPMETGARAAPAGVPQPGSAGGGPTLPFELRQVASRYPVTLYSRPDCPPCTSARSFLNQRGIPFAERTVTTQEDVAALQRLSGAATLPFLTIGSQQIPGYSDIEWGEFLDAAGYPKTSQLPPNYRNPPPAPLVAATTPRPLEQPSAQQPAAQQTDGAEQPPRALPRAVPRPAPAPRNDNPAGIQF